MCLIVVQPVGFFPVKKFHRLCIQMDSVIYIPAASWNPDGWKDKRNIYTDDHFHLNLPGYALLDSAFAANIIKDYRQRKNFHKH